MREHLYMLCLRFWIIMGTLVLFVSNRKTSTPVRVGIALSNKQTETKLYMLINHQQGNEKVKPWELSSHTQTPSLESPQPLSSQNKAEPSQENIHEHDHWWISDITRLYNMRESTHHDNTSKQYKCTIDNRVTWLSELPGPTQSGMQ